MRKELKYKSINNNQRASIDEIKECASLLLDAIDNYCPKSREQSLAKTKVEEAVMWASKAVSHND